jgi:hypothetical protein
MGHSAKAIYTLAEDLAKLTGETKVQATANALAQRLMRAGAVKEGAGGVDHGGSGGSAHPLSDRAGQQKRPAKAPKLHFFDAGLAGPHRAFVGQGRARFLTGAASSL